MFYADLLELMALSTDAAQVFRTAGWPPATAWAALPPRYLVRQAAAAAVGDLVTQGHARAALNTWLQTHMAWLTEAPPQEPRSVRLDVRLTPSELQQLRANAYAMGCDMSTYVRARLFEDRPEHPQTPNPTTSSRMGGAGNASGTLNAARHEGPREQ